MGVQPATVQQPKSRLAREQAKEECSLGKLEAVSESTACLCHPAGLSCWTPGDLCWPAQLKFWAWAEGWAGAQLGQVFLMGKVSSTGQWNLINK